MISQTENNSILEYFRPHGKIVCIGEDLSAELRILQEYLALKTESRLPLLLLTTNPYSKSSICDQVVIFESEAMFSQIKSLLNSFFLFFIFNSSEENFLGSMGKILASIEFSGSIPIFIDTGRGLSSDQRKIFGAGYFNFDFSEEKNRWNFLMLLDGLISSLTPKSGFGISFSDLIQIFGNSDHIFHGISSSETLDVALKDSIDQIGNGLISLPHEELELLDSIFLSVTSAKTLSIHTMNDTTTRLVKTFGNDFNIHFSIAVDSSLQGFNVVLILTDSHPMEEIFPSSSPISILKSIIPKISYPEVKNKNPSIFSRSVPSDEDNRFEILSKIFTDSEVYIFNDGGLPLFSSHQPDGQEVCLYTGLFSAIQALSSDLIGHAPDHLTAGDKRCVFVSNNGTQQDSQLRGVAICSAGFEERARNDLSLSMKLVYEMLETGEPEYAINDKIQGLLVQGFQNGSVNSLSTKQNIPAS
ncbi:MAG: hypothetical protein ACXAC8_16355 [Candidatus Hodarchaeales archaeon]